MRDEHKHHTRHKLFLIISAFLVGAFSAYLWQQSINKTKIDTQKEQITRLQVELDSTVLNQQERSPNFDYYDVGSDYERYKPVTSYEPVSDFSDQDKKQINEKLVSPYSLYFKDSEQKPVSFHIKLSSDKSNWEVLIIGKDSSYKKIDFGDTSEDIQSWWIPKCINICSFDSEFSQKYPNIVSVYSNGEAN